MTPEECGGAVRRLRHNGCLNKLEDEGPARLVALTRVACGLLDEPDLPLRAIRDPQDAGARMYPRLTPQIEWRCRYFMPETMRPTDPAARRASR